MGQIPASAAAAAAAALEYHCNRVGERPTNLSTLFIHFNARRLSGTEATNGGTSMEAVMQGITTFGACREDTWPLAAGTVTTRPPAQAYLEAKRFAAVRPLHPADLREALALQYPTAVVARVPMRCLTEAGRTGVLPALTAEEQQRRDHPVHALLIVGYDSRARTYLARNCWGDRWGDRGYCRIAFDVLHALVPPGSQNAWAIAKGDAAADHTVAPAAAGVLDASSSSAPRDTLASLAARMRSEIRDDLQRDLADATQRIRDRMTPPSGAGSQQPGSRACTYCNGTKACRSCGGAGCSSCSRTGRCAICA